MIRKSFRHVVTVLVLLVAFVCQETWSLAGTTGGLSGIVRDADSSAPVAGAVVTASSPSQSATGTTDAAGRFTFLTLAPDTYTLTVTKSGYQPESVPGQVVFADTVQSVSVRLPKALQTIAHVAATGAGSLVKSGTTSDIYSINATTQRTVAALGGGGSLNSAYSAIATIPGAYVVPNQTGYFQTVHIRGGDFDQVGYEFDGVPVNRSFDNYASSSASSLGNAEVQVYTGANPANSEGQGLSGYINQVIKTGAFPGYAEGSLGIGTPAFYHRAAVEIGGATPDRLFSYYVGISGSSQAYNYVNNQNGSEYYNWIGVPLGFIPNASYAPPWLLGNIAGLPPSEIALGPIQWSAFSTIFAHNVVANFHFGIPHHNDAGRDDVQVLYDNESLSNQLYESLVNVASPQCTGAASASAATCAAFINSNGSTTSPLALPTYNNTPTWNCPGSIGGTFSRAGLNKMTNCITNYGFPNQANPGTLSAPNTIPLFDADHSYNQTAIVKLQYTKNMGSNAFVRVYGYSFYSLWSLAGAIAGSFCNFVCSLAPDYELSTHTRGLSAEFSDQINAENLVSLQGSYTTASVVRDNNGLGTGNTAVVVNSKDPYGGYCYSAATPGSVVNCNQNGIGLGPSFSVPALPRSCAVPGHPSFGTNCTYMLAENGLSGTYSNTTPNFYSFSLTDLFRPNDKWLINLGVRLDSFGFVGGDTTVPPLGGSAEARAFWFNAYNLDNCVNNLSGAPFPNPTPAQVCPAGSHGAVLINDSAQEFVYNIWQPRISGTYTVDPNSVIRFSYGRYTEAPNTAFAQYNTRQQDLADYLGTHFLQFGRNTPGYPIVPPTSINYDLSFEHHFKGTDWSFKLTPFLRQTQGQIQNFFLNVKQGFISGLNVGSQRSEGVEFQAQKGDFARDGISGILAFAYTNSYIHYGPIAAGSQGTTVLGGVNDSIAQYNAYTKACVNHPHNVNCGTTSTGVTAGPCYTLAVGSTPGSPVASLPGGSCPAGTIANPYWTSALQPLVDTSAAFPTYDIFPGATGIAAQGFGSPYVASLVLNYRHQKLAVTPSFQFQGGGKYGYPLSSVGIDPTACAGALAGTTRYDATTCGNVVNIPNPFTGVFDGIGGFTQPNQFLANLQLSYDVSPRISITGVLASIVNYCWGGTKAPWTFNDGNLCSYNNLAGNLDPIAPNGTPGAVVNPPGSKTGSIVQSFFKFPYQPTFGPALVSGLNFALKTPFQFYLTANVKI
jgi:hypothetical protein